MDETGVMLSMPGTVKVLVSKDDLRGHTGARVKRTVVTAIECASGDGRCLNPMVIWPASTHRANWTTFPTPGWHYAYSETGYTDSYISFEWLKRVFDPKTKARANQKPRVLIFDGFGSHEMSLGMWPVHHAHKGIFPASCPYKNQSTFNISICPSDTRHLKSYSS
jgi:hypothetical protein